MPSQIGCTLPDPELQWNTMHGASDAGNREGKMIKDSGKKKIFTKHASRQSQMSPTRTPHSKKRCTAECGQCYTDSIPATSHAYVACGFPKAFVARKCRARIYDSRSNFRRLALPVIPYKVKGFFFVMLFFPAKPSMPLTLNVSGHSVAPQLDGKPITPAQSHICDFNKVEIFIK